VKRTLAGHTVKTGARVASFDLFCGTRTPRQYSQNHKFIRIFESAKVNSRAKWHSLPRGSDCCNSFDVKAYWTRVRLPPPPPDGVFDRGHLVGVTWFRQGEIAKKAAGEVTDLIGTNP
jgi:hypothetical protein